MISNVSNHRIRRLPFRLAPLKLQDHSDRDFFLLRHGLLVHAPGEIAGIRRGTPHDFRVRGWPKEPYWVLVNGLRQTPAVKINGAPAPHEFDLRDGLLTLQLTGEPLVELEW
jgi:hypothetical protein